MKSSMPFKRDSALQNIYLSKQPFKKSNPGLKMKMSLQVLDIICPSQEPINKHRALSLREMEIDG